MDLAQLAEALAISLEAPPLAFWMLMSTWGYPFVNLVHLLGLILLIGPIGLLDLRLLGFGLRFAVVDVSAVLTPFVIAGLLLLIASGALLFSADALPLHRHALLQAKLTCIAVGLANTVAFRLVWTQQLADWARHPPLPGRIHALLSLLMWPAVGTLGRLLAYR